MTSNAAQLLQAALWHARQGIHVFPLQLADKRPRKGSHGELDGTLDEDQIQRWWSRIPWNIGAALRFTEYFALDIDARSNGEELFETIETENGPLPDTVTVISASGWPNRHLWFRKPAELSDCRVRGLGIGIDVKGLGHGYVLLPPSSTAKGVYTYEANSYLGRMPVAQCPDWLTKRLLSIGKAKISNTPHVNDVDPRTFLLGWYFMAEGLLGKQIKPGVFAIRCPNEHQHSCGKPFDGSSVLYAPNVLGFTRKSNPLGAVLCLHAHCAHLTDEFIALGMKAQGLDWKPAEPSPDQA